MTMIMNEFDMFRVLLEKAEKKEVDKEKSGDFFEGVKQLSSVLSFVKMKEVEEGLLFERGSVAFFRLKGIERPVGHRT